jgi:hypothetical protein
LIRRLVDLLRRFTKWAWDKKDPLTGLSRVIATLGLLVASELWGLGSRGDGDCILSSGGSKGWVYCLKGDSPSSVQEGYSVLGLAKFQIIVEWKLSSLSLPTLGMMVRYTMIYTFFGVRNRTMKREAGGGLPWFFYIDSV